MARRRAGWRLKDQDSPGAAGGTDAGLERGPPWTAAPGRTKTIYEPPILVDLNPSERVRGVSCLGGNAPGGYVVCDFGDSTAAYDECGQGNYTEWCHGGGTASSSPCTYAYGCCHGPSANPECHAGSTPSYYCNGGLTATSCTAGTST